MDGHDGGIQERARFKIPALADLGAVRQVAHVTQHAAIGRGLLGGIVGVIGRVRTDQCEDVCQHRTRQLSRHVVVGMSSGRAGRRLVIGRAPRTAPWTGPEAVQKPHRERCHAEESRSLEGEKEGSR